MKKWIITTVLLICICAGVVAYAIIAPDFNISEKAKQTTSNSIASSDKESANYIDENKLIHLNDEYTIQIKELQYGTKDDKKIAMFVMEYTNNTSEYDSYGMSILCKAYQSDRELKSTIIIDDNYPNEIMTEVRNGESTQIVQCYELENFNDNVYLHFRKGWGQSDSESVEIYYTLK